MKATAITTTYVMVLLREYGVQTRGAHCVIIGRSNIVGKPMAALMVPLYSTLMLMFAPWFTPLTRRSGFFPLSSL